MRSNPLDNTTITGVTMVSEGERSTTFSFIESFHLTALSDHDVDPFRLHLLLGCVQERRLTDVERAIPQLVRRHTALRTSFVCAPDIADCVRVIHKDRGRAITQRGARVLNPADLWRVTTVPLGRGRCAVGLEIAHVIADYQSLRILRRDFDRAMTAVEVRGPALATAAGHEVFAARETAHFTSFERTVGELNFWAQYLGDAPPMSRLPGAEMASEGVRAGRRMTYRLPRDVSSWVMRAPAQLRITSAAVLFGALSLAHARVFESPGLSGLTVVSNRTDSDLRHTVGFLANEVPFGITVQACGTPEAAMTAAHSSLMRLLTHQRLPYRALKAAEIQLGALFGIEPRPEPTVMVQYLHTDPAPETRPAPTGQLGIIEVPVPTRPVHIGFRRVQGGITLTCNWQLHVDEASVFELLNELLDVLSTAANVDRAPWHSILGDRARSST